MNASELEGIRKRDEVSRDLWFTGPPSFTALAARDRRTLLAWQATGTAIIRDLTRQITEFAERYGEADFYTGEAIAFLNPQGTEETGSDRPAAPVFESVGWQYRFPSIWGGFVWRDSSDDHNGSRYVESREIFAKREMDASDTCQHEPSDCAEWHCRKCGATLTVEAPK